MPLIQPEIAGYRQLTQAQADLINTIKGHGDIIGALISQLEKDGDADQRWLAIGTSQLQQGIMAIVRAIARPTNF